MKISAMKDFIENRIDEKTLNESAFNKSTDPDVFSEADEQLMNETLAEAMPFLIADDIIMEAYDKGEVIFQESMTELQSYLKSNGLLSESFSMSNPKKNYVRLNRMAILERLRSILIIKLARKNNDKNYKKYKIGTKIKRNSFREMEKRWGAKATPMAKKIYQNKARKNKIVTVIDNSKAKNK